MYKTSVFEVNGFERINVTVFGLKELGRASHCLTSYMTMLEFS